MLRSAVLALLLTVPALAGCIGEMRGDELEEQATGLEEDEPAVEPSLYEGWHDVDAIEAFQAKLEAEAPEIVEPLTVGDSVEERPLLGVRLTSPDGEASQRVPVLVDGGIHGNEFYGIETTLYLAAWLVENHGRNATATTILETAVVDVVFSINPDGQAAESRANANGVDLNRNFEIDHGSPDPRCRSNTLLPQGPYYAGSQPFSEPESTAIRDLMEETEPEVYISHHTGRHAVIRPWGACDPPYEMPDRDDSVYEAIEAWARENTAYQNTGTAEETADRAFPPGRASGSSMDWCYMRHKCVSITFEVSETYGQGETPPGEVAREAHPLNVHLLKHADTYAAWEIPEAAS